MADILLFKKTNYMDLMDPERLNFLRSGNPKMEYKYQNRYMPGDPIQVEETGYWSDPVNGLNFRHDTFCVLCIENVTKAQALQYASCAVGGEVTLKKKRYRFDLSGLTFINDIAVEKQWQNVVIIDKVNP